MDSLYIVMPAYNEEDNIESVVRSWYPLLKGKSPDSKLIIADSGSSDSTHNILVSLQQELHQLEIITNTDKGHGPKLIALYKHAINNGIDYVFQTDSDGQTSPQEFDFFWKNRKKYDSIIGNRTVREDGKDRAFVEYVVCFLLRIYFGVKVPDANAPFRLMSTKSLAKYIAKLPSDYNIPNIMLTTFFAFYKEDILFKEISFKPRQAGNNSINLMKITKIGLNAIKDFRRFKREMRK